MSTKDTSRLPLKPLAALAALVLLVAPAFAEPEKEGGKPKVETATFKSGGKRVAVECSKPTKPGKYPAVVLLHAVDGIDATWGPLYRDLAAEYAGRGYVVVLVHYFDRTDPDKKERAGYRDLFVNHFNRKETPRKEQERMTALFGAWGEAVRDAVVPVEEAYLLAGLLVARKQRPEVEVLAGAEHMFLKDGKTLQRWPLAVAKMKVDAFLTLHLGEKRVAKAAP